MLISAMWIPWIYLFVFPIATLLVVGYRIHGSDVEFTLLCALLYVMSFKINMFQLWDISYKTVNICHSQIAAYWLALLQGETCIRPEAGITHIIAYFALSLVDQCNLSAIL